MNNIWTTASVYLLLHHILIFTIHYSTRFLSLWLEGEETWVVSVGPPSEKFNIISNDHWRTQKCNFCGSVGKTNFTEHDIPDTINGFRDSVLVCKMHDCYCTLRKNSFSSSTASGKRLQWLDYMYMKTNHFKMLLNVFSTTYTYSNRIAYRLFYCQKITSPIFVAK